MLLATSFGIHRSISVKEYVQVYYKMNRFLLILVKYTLLIDLPFHS